MSTPDDFSKQMTEKTEGRLQDMLAHPDRCSPEEINAARAELQKRGIRPIEPVSKPAKITKEPGNPLALLSLIGAICAAFISGSANTAGELNYRAPITGLIGIASLVAGVQAMRRAKIVHKGKGLAIFGIILSALTAIFILWVPENMLRESAERQAAKNLVGQAVPHFVLSQQGKSDTDLAGSVYILDFGGYPDSDSIISLFFNDPMVTNLPSIYSVGYQDTATRRAFFAYAGPETVIIGRDSRVVAVLLADRSKDALAKIIVDTTRQPYPATLQK